MDTSVAHPPDVRAAPGQEPRSADQPGSLEIRGQVRYAEFHAAPREFGEGAQDWLTFHLHTLDPESRRALRLRVVVRSNRVSELVIRDGDTVVVRGERTGRGEVAASYVENLTTRSRLDLGLGRGWAATLKVPVGALSVLAIPAFILAVIALICGEVTTGVSVGAPCIGVWLAFWGLGKLRA